MTEVQSDIPQKTKLDLSKYRSPELVDRIVELISIPKAIFKIFCFAILGAVAFLVVGCLVFWGTDVSIWVRVLLVAGFTLIGFLCGGLFAIVWLIQNALTNIEGVLTIMLDTTRLAAGDYSNVRSGETELPSSGELFQQSYEQILAPSLETATKKAFGFLSRPMLWIYRRSIGSIVKNVIRRVSSEKIDDTIQSTATTSKLAGTEQYSTQVESFAERAKRVVESVGGKLKFIALFPLYGLLFMIVGLAILGLVLARVLLG